MRYDLSTPYGAKQARVQFEYLIDKGANIELTEKRKVRTLNQNRYLHLILTAWGGHLGYTLAEMKQKVKRRLPAMFEYEKNGEEFKRGTSDLNTREMTDLIDWIRATSEFENGYYIPAPNETELLQSLQNEAERYERYNAY